MTVSPTARPAAAGWLWSTPSAAAGVDGYFATDQPPPPPPPPDALFGRVGQRWQWQ